MSQYREGTKLHVVATVRKDGLIDIGDTINQHILSIDCLEIAKVIPPEFQVGDKVKFRHGSAWNQHEWKVIGRYENEIYVQSDYGKIYPADPDALRPA